MAAVFQTRNFWLVVSTLFLDFVFIFGWKWGPVILLQNVGSGLGLTQAGRSVFCAFGGSRSSLMFTSLYLSILPVIIHYTLNIVSLLL